MSAPIRVLLVDDHRIMLEGLALLIAGSGDMEVVAQALDGATALAQFEAIRPDVCIADLRMRPMDGVELTEQIRKRVPDAKVILLTTYDTDDEIFRGFRAGIATYLLKDIDSAGLLQAIRSVHAGHRIIAPGIALKLAEHVAADALTPRQEEVLQLVALGKTNLEIADTIFISEGTVKAHVRAILHKLGARDRTQAITVAIRRGLVRT
ncbi:MAG: response regulator transcription factor [Gemmatimonadaceae bacterium]|nr:response regulator transcription factor [Gemmatimonadaceae bacterium]